MPIQSQDVKLFKSDTMDDTSNGGGLQTNQEVSTGVSNQVFDDISTLSRTFGDLNMRKLYAAVDTATNDKHLGAHTIISKIPSDTQIGINLFSTKSHSDRRDEAQTRVENYRAKGATYGGFLWVTQFKDSKVISIFQNATTPLPSVGDVLYLSQANDQETQFIKITSFDVETRTFTDEKGSFNREILSLEISQGLDYDFIGSEISRLDTISPEATIKETVVANAAKYYSARPLSVQGELGDLSVKVDTVFSQVIPSSLQELAIIDANAAGESTSLVTSGNTVSFSYNNNIVPLTNIFLGRACTPSTLSIPVSGGTIIDDGGQLKIGATTIGTINYHAGSILFGAVSPTYTGNKTITFTPSVAPVLATSSAAQTITAANRGFVYVITLLPKPLRTSLRVQYSALGEWFILFDNGSGGLAGQEAGIGSGTIDYDTGTVSVTLGALPDADTQIIYTWTEQTEADVITATGDKAYYELTLLNGGTKYPDFTSISVTWDDGSPRTATGTGIGSFSGDATGVVDIANNIVRLEPDNLAPPNTVFTINYTEYDREFHTISGTEANVSGEVVFNSGATNIEPNRFVCNISYIPEDSWYNDTYINENGTILPHSIQLKDDGLGGIIVDPLYQLTVTTYGSSLVSPDAVVGSINYATGAITLPNRVNNLTKVNQFVDQTVGTRKEPNGFGFDIVDDIVRVNTGSITEDRIYVYYIGEDIKTLQTSNVAPVVATTSPTPSLLTFQLSKPLKGEIIAGSTVITIGGVDHIDDNGVILKSFDNTDGTATVVGSLDYSTGIVNLTSWTGGTPNSISVGSSVVNYDFKPVSSIMGRVPSAPVKTLSFQFSVSSVSSLRPIMIGLTVAGFDGEPATLLTATSDGSGFITGTNINGFIDYDSGVYNINFHAAGDVNTKIYVDGQTMRYNAVSSSFLPLDESVLGINPVRLPSDGRIPIYDGGDVVVILNDGNTSATFTSFTTTTLSRGRQSKITVVDSASNPIDTNLYSVDLDIGTVTWGDLSGLSQPLTIIDRIEDLAVVSDVQITGTLTITKPLSHVFPVAGTLVSNAIINGDTFANTSAPFDQQTFTGVWSDSLIGSQVTANFNNGLTPIVVDNHSCINERWMLQFTNSTTVNIIGENVGQIATGVSILSTIQPTNPATGFPYFTISTASWGSGWSSGNILRFNTVSASYPIWVLQSVGQGDATSDDLEFCIEVRGDIDTP